MKHLFKDIPQSEKNRILEMHGSKRFIQEAEASAQQFKAQAQKAASCFSEKNTPQLYKLATGMGLGALAVGAFALSYFTAGAADGISGGMAVTTGIFASGAALQKLYDAITNDKSTFEKELKFLYNCIF